MPIYDYKCDKCSNKVEIMRKISQRDYAMKCICSGCEGTMHREASAPAVHYDGLKSGDY